MPCVAVTHASRPEAGSSASRLSGLAHLRTSLAPTVLLVGHAFEAVLMRGAEPDPPCVDHIRASLPSLDQPESIE
jgi:hypothetical protein